MSPSTIRRLIASGQLRAVQAVPGGAVRVLEAELVAAVDRWRAA